MLKKTPRGVLVTVLVCAALAVLFFIVPVRSKGKLIEPLTFALVAAFMISMSIYSWLQHGAALRGKRLRWLLDHGFSTEEHGGYQGLKGNYGGYFVRVYVNPESRFYRRLGPDLCILVYFHPMRTREGKRDIALLRKIENDLLEESSWFRFEYLSCHAIHWRSITRFTIWTKRSHVERRIRRLIACAERYGLKPWPEVEVEKWVQESPELHGPDMEEFRAGCSSSKRT